MAWDQDIGLAGTGHHVRALSVFSPSLILGHLRSIFDKKKRERFLFPLSSLPHYAKKTSVKKTLLKRRLLLLLSHPLLFLPNAVVVIGDRSSFGEAGTFLKCLPDHLTR